MTTFQVIEFLGDRILLLPERAVFLESASTLLLSDVHLGKAETFQSFGIPIPNLINQSILSRLQKLCLQHSPKRLIILGDLFHSARGLVNEVVDQWQGFLESNPIQVQFLLGNHDRRFTKRLEAMGIECVTAAISLNSFILSHEPEDFTKQNTQASPSQLNICGHLHPCIRLKSRLETLRLPCFYFDRPNHQLVLPSFGDFTGGYEVSLKPGAIAYAIVEESVIPFS